MVGERGHTEAFNKGWGEAARAKGQGRSACKLMPCMWSPGLELASSPIAQRKSLRSPLFSGLPRLAFDHVALFAALAVSASTMGEERKLA